MLPVGVKEPTDCALAIGPPSATNKRSVRTRAVVKDFLWPLIFAFTSHISARPSHKEPPSLDRDVYRCACDPRRAYLDAGHALRHIRRHPKIHLIAVRRARVTYGAQTLGVLSIHHTLDWRIDRSQRTRREWPAGINPRGHRAKPRRKQRQELSRGGRLRGGHQREIAGMGRSGSIGSGHDLRHCHGDDLEDELGLPASIDTPVGRVLRNRGRARTIAGTRTRLASRAKKRARSAYNRPIAPLLRQRRSRRRGSAAESGGGNAPDRGTVAFQDLEEYIPK